MLKRMFISAWNRFRLRCDEIDYPTGTNFADNILQYLSKKPHILLIQETHTIFVSQRRNIMELFIINYPKEQILDGTNVSKWCIFCVLKRELIFHLTENLH